jgi:ubiquinol-cytochrome c reductase cytochrome c subunit
VQGTDRRAPPVNRVEVAYADLVLRTGRMPPVGNPFDNRLREPTVTGEDRKALVAWMTAEFGVPGTSPASIGAIRHRACRSTPCSAPTATGSSGTRGVAGESAYTPAAHQV